LCKPPEPSDGFSALHIEWSPGGATQFSGSKMVFWRGNCAMQRSHLVALLASIMNVVIVKYNKRLRFLSPYFYLSPMSRESWAVISAQFEWSRNIISRRTEFCMKTAEAPLHLYTGPSLLLSCLWSSRTTPHPLFVNRYG
jgi:hypothetical protein